MEGNGFTMELENVTNLGKVKQDYGIPSQLQSCHTAIVDGYIIEGHVPIADITRLLDERPDIKGLAVPGMPIGSPGMEVPGTADDPFDVLAFDEAGQTTVFSSYN